MPKPLPSTPSSAQFVRHVLGFGVGVAVGLAPFLGKVKVPGFSALLQLFPEGIREPVISLSAFSMGLIAISVQFFSGRRLQRRKLDSFFARTIAFSLANFLFLIVIYYFTVVQVPIGGGAAVAAFVIGNSRLPSCDCAMELSDVTCIKELSLEVGAVETCWSQAAIRRNKLLLTLAYLGLTGGFGALVGVLTMHPQQQMEKKTIKPQ